MYWLSVTQALVIPAEVQVYMISHVHVVTVHMHIMHDHVTVSLLRDSLAMQ